jgi:hypothetical protein
VRATLMVQGAGSTTGQAPRFFFPRGAWACWNSSSTNDRLSALDGGEFAASAGAGQPKACRYLAERTLLSSAPRPASFRARCANSSTSHRRARARGRNRGGHVARANSLRSRSPSPTGLPLSRSRVARLPQERPSTAVRLVVRSHLPADSCGFPHAIDRRSERFFGSDGRRLLIRRTKASAWTARPRYSDSPVPSARPKRQRCVSGRNW